MNSISSWLAVSYRLLASMFSRFHRQLTAEIRQGSHLCIGVCRCSSVIDYDPLQLSVEWLSRQQHWIESLEISQQIVTSLYTCVFSALAFKTFCVFICMYALNCWSPNICSFLFWCAERVQMSALLLSLASVMTMMSALTDLCDFFYIVDLSPSWVHSKITGFFFWTMRTTEWLLSCWWDS